MMVPFSPEEVDPAWMTAVLQQAGLSPDCRVTGLRWSPVGVGMLADSARFHIEYDRSASKSPATLIGKFAAADPSSRDFSLKRGLYENEVRFYAEMAPLATFCVPQAFFTAMAPEGRHFAILMEDLSPARVEDQVAGCSTDDIRRILAQAARLHGQRWGDPELFNVRWLMRRTRQGFELAEIYARSLPAFESRYREVLGNDVIDLCKRAAARSPALLSIPARHYAVKHGDLRLDNILFDVRGGTVPAILDWQTAAVGHGLADVAFLIGTSLEPDVRRNAEGALLQGYHTELQSRGVISYSLDECWRDYCFQSCHCLLTAVVASIGARRTVRGDAVFMAMARRGAAMVHDLGALT